MYIDNHLDQGKSIISDRRARSWVLHDGAEHGYEDAVNDSSSDSDSGIPLAKNIHGSRATPILSSDSDIPLVKITHGSRATPILISNRKRPTLAKLATAVDNLFLMY